MTTKTYRGTLKGIGTINGFQTVVTISYMKVFAQHFYTDDPQMMRLLDNYTQKNVGKNPTVEVQANDDRIVGFRVV